LEIASAVQGGNVTMHIKPASQPGVTAEQPSDASAARAVYDGASSKLTLTGGAHYTQGDTSLTAATIGVNQQTGDAEAEGNVLATMSGTASTPRAGAKPVAKQADSPMTHVAADHAILRHASQLAEFISSDAHPARLWQGASQVQAADLLFDQKKRSLAARPTTSAGLVHAVFAGASQGSAKKPAEGVAKLQGDGDQIVRVVSSAMDYDDVNREATFTGAVKIDGTTGQARSQRGVVFLNPAQAGAVQSAAQANPFGGSVRRVVLSGDVRIDQPGRTGTGEQLVYTAADSSYIFTGTPAKPPHIVDAQQGNVTGATLLFHSGDSTIVVGGTDAGAKAEKPARVRTETRVKQQ